MNNHPAFSRPNDEPLLPRTNPNQSISRPPCCVSTSNLWRYGFQLTIQMMILTCFFNKHAIDYASSVSDFFSASPLYINWLANDQVFDPNLSHYPYPTGNWSSLVPDSCTHTWKQFRLQHRLEDSNLLACQNTSFDRFFNSIQHTKTQLRPQFWNMIFLTAASIVLTTLYTCRCAPQKLLQLILNFFTVTMCFSPPILKHINRYRELLCKSQIPAPCSLQPFSEHHVITDYNDIPGYSDTLYQGFPQALTFTGNYLIDTLIVAVLSNTISFTLTFALFDSPLADHIKARRQSFIPDHQPLDLASPSTTL